MKLIIAGGRNYEFTIKDLERLHCIHSVTPISEVVCGNATGADTEGRLWADANDIPIKRFPANWKKHGRAAGPIRNAEMAAYADAVALFPGGKGTDNMAMQAKKAGLTIFDFRK